MCAPVDASGEGRDHTVPPVRHRSPSHPQAPRPPVVHVVQVRRRHVSTGQRQDRSLLHVVVSLATRLPRQRSQHRLQVHLG
eukprot:750627-Hanusia_phi.AAC.10